MRRSLANLAMAFTSASVGRRNVSRSVSRTQLLASRNVEVGISCSITGSCSRNDTQQRQQKRRLVSRLPSGAFQEPPPVQQDRQTQYVHRLLGRLSHRNHRHEGATVTLGTKLHMAFDLGKKSMVGAHADIKAGVPGGAALPRDDVAGNHALAAIGLDSKAFARRITTVTR